MSVWLLNVQFSSLDLNTRHYGPVFKLFLETTTWNPQIAINRSLWYILGGAIWPITWVLPLNTWHYFVLFFMFQNLGVCNYDFNWTLPSLYIASMTNHLHLQGYKIIARIHIITVQFILYVQCWTIPRNEDYQTLKCPVSDESSIQVSNFQMVT